jgi:hypothetical protein
MPLPSALSQSVADATLQAVSGVYRLNRLVEHEARDQLP